MRCYLICQILIFFSNASFPILPSSRSNSQGSAWRDQFLAQRPQPAWSSTCTLWMFCDCTARRCWTSTRCRPHTARGPDTDLQPQTPMKEYGQISRTVQFPWKHLNLEKKLLTLSQLHQQMWCKRSGNQFTSIKNGVLCMDGGEDKFFYKHYYRKISQPLLATGKRKQRWVVNLTGRDFTWFYMTMCFTTYKLQCYLNFARKCNRNIATVVQQIFFSTRHKHDKPVSSFRLIVDRSIGFFTISK